MPWLDFCRLSWLACIHIVNEWLDDAEITWIEAALAAYPVAERRHDATGERSEIDATIGPLAVVRRRIDAATGVDKALGTTLRYRCYRAGEGRPLALFAEHCSPTCSRWWRHDPAGACR